MQIITGKFRGRKLESPKGDQTRPTLARVKTSVFSMVQDFVPGANVLDLFAGSGAFGAECVSRGAKSVVLVDQDANAKVAIQKNLRGMEYELVDLPVEHALFRLHNQKLQFDLIFMDPPYESDLGILSLRLIARLGLLAQNGLIVFETSTKNHLQNIPKSYTIVKEREYGVAKIIILEQKNE